LLLLLLIVAAGGGAAIGYWWYQNSHALPPGIAAGNGRIEAQEVDIASKYAGRVAAVLVEEGDMVEIGQTVARMDTADLEVDLAKAEAEVLQAERALAAAQADVARYDSEARLAKQELDRVQALIAKGFSTIQELDHRVSAKETADSARAAAVAQVAVARQAVEVAEKGTQQVQVKIDDSLLRSPVQGRVQYRLVEPEEVIAAGGKVATLLDFSNVYMTMYLPTELAGQVELGDEARIIVDALPDEPIPAKVSFVASKAQFTPKTVETSAERAKLMFRIKVRIDPAILRRHLEEIRVGLPGVAYIQLDPKQPWPAWLALTGRL
jgi:HlyD family secretion protein